MGHRYILLHLHFGTIVVELARFGVDLGMNESLHQSEPFAVQVRLSILQSHLLEYFQLPLLMQVEHQELPSLPMHSTLAQLTQLEFLLCAPRVRQL